MNTNADSVKYHSDLDALSITLRGKMSVERFIPIYEQTLSHPEFHSGINLIWDATRATIHHMSIDDFKVLLKHVSKSVNKRGYSNSAWLIRDIDDYRLACMVKALFGHFTQIRYEVFQSLYEAESWIRNERKMPRHREVV